MKYNEELIGVIDEIRLTKQTHGSTIKTNLIDFDDIKQEAAQQTTTISSFSPMNYEETVKQNVRIVNRICVDITSLYIINLVYLIIFFIYRWIKAKTFRRECLFEAENQEIGTTKGRIGRGMEINHRYCSLF